MRGGGNSTCNEITISKRSIDTNTSTVNNAPTEPVNINEYEIKLVYENNDHKLKNVLKSSMYRIDPAPLSVDEIILVVKEKVSP